MGTSFTEFVALVLGTMGGTTILKAIVNYLAGGDSVLAGNAARYVSIATAFGLTIAGFALGYVQLPIPEGCSVDAIFSCSQAWLTWGALVASTANLAYEQIIERVMG